jgi:hypothetical protein
MNIHSFNFSVLITFLFAEAYSIAYFSQFPKGAVNQ